MYHSSNVSNIYRPEILLKNLFFVEFDYFFEIISLLNMNMTTEFKKIIEISPSELNFEASGFLSKKMDDFDLKIFH